jgi:hypothetical protein
MSRGNIVQTEHDLDFLAAPWELPDGDKAIVRMATYDDDKYPDIEWQLFRVGTCIGQWRLTPEAYEILSVINEKPGNGHLDDLLEWFEYGCRRSKLPLRILAFTNDGFKKHLLEKRGFVPFGDDVEKKYGT